MPVGTSRHDTNITCEYAQALRRGHVRRRDFLRSWGRRECRPSPARRRKMENGIWQHRSFGYHWGPSQRSLSPHFASKIRGNTTNRSPAGFEVSDPHRLRRCASKNLWRSDCRFLQQAFEQQYWLTPKSSGHSTDARTAALIAFNSQNRYSRQNNGPPAILV